MSTPHIILGLVGEMAAGKSTLTEYLKSAHSAVTFRFSDMLRDVLERLHLEDNRSNLQMLSTALRQTFGDDLMSKVIAADVQKSAASFIITEGVRRPSDVTYLRQIPGYILIAVTAGERLRYERITKRTENPDDQTKTWAEFLSEGQREAEQKIREIAARANFTIDNNGSKEELFSSMEKILAKLYSPS
ncbi:MAG: AAA family ATPase [Candidatus Magasanikbacteria bacterium]|nr:AAA family ATPase [Candidatus Magasanikbacteria bacterium]